MSGFGMPVGARVVVTRVTTAVNTPAQVSTPDALSGWFALVHAGPPAGNGTAVVRLIDSGGNVVCLSPMGADTTPNGPNHPLPGFGYFFVHPDVRFEVVDVLRAREWFISWVRGPHSREKGMRAADMIPYTVQLPANALGQGGAWNDAGPSGGLPPSPSRPWVQITAAGPAGQGIDVRFSDLAGVDTLACTTGEVGVIGGTRGSIFHHGALRLQLRSTTNNAKRILCTWSSEGGKAP